MPVLHFTPSPSGPSGSAPSAPSQVTSIAKDAAATVSFLAPASSGSSGITSYTATPYITGAAQSATTTAVGSAGSITGSNGNTYVQIPATGLTNGTAYTFTVHASNTSATGPESAQSGGNTPLSGLVFGDDFNGPASGPVDPEWWIYNRCGYIAQSEVEWYLPGQCILDGSGSLQLIGTHTSHSGPSYPSDGNTTRNQSWLSGGCQSNAKTWAPITGNTMTFEARQQICPGISSGMWPGLFWLAGQTRLNDWKTDPLQTGWDSTGQAEIDIAEFNPSIISGTGQYLCNTWNSSSPDQFTVTTGLDFSASMHVFNVQWKPGVSAKYNRDGALIHSSPSGNVPATGAQFMLLLYLQILASAASSPQICLIDYVRVYDQNLG